MQRPRGRHAVRPASSTARIDHQSTMGAYVGTHRREGRQGRDGRLALRRRQGLPAQRRRGAAAAAGAVAPWRRPHGAHAGG
ncbi:MAG: hypothetical protein MZW92_40100 [Comamonadaceae bacterium]|nr:hypothetical protein [Comamonadaceae bacterium]